MKLKMFRTHRVLAFLTLCLGLVHSWDVAVSYGNKLRFYTQQTLISTITFATQSLSALAYDDVHKIILYVDKKTYGDAICGYSLTSAENKCYTERTGRKIHGIAYDSVTDTVFFTDIIERTVNSFSLTPGSENNARGNLLIQVGDGIPRDITVDSCKRHIYWMNTDKPNPTIERARLTGTEREVFHTMNSVYITATYRFEPHSLTIDPQTHKIYWCEPWNTKKYDAYSNTLNKTEKTSGVHIHLARNPVFIHPSNTFAVTNSLFFFVDFRYFGPNVYIVGKEFTNVTGFPPLAKIEHKGALLRIPVGIVANYPITEENQDCEIF